MPPPPPTDECWNAITAAGHLTVGWYTSVSKAWKIVLDVLGIGEDGQPVPQTVYPRLQRVPQPNASLEPPITVHPLGAMAMAPLRPLSRL